MTGDLDTVRFQISICTIQLLPNLIFRKMICLSWHLVFLKWCVFTCDSPPSWFISLIHFLKIIHLSLHVIFFLKSCLFPHDLFLQMIHSFPHVIFFLQDSFISLHDLYLKWLICFYIWIVQCNNFPKWFVFTCDSPPLWFIYLIHFPTMIHLALHVMFFFPLFTFFVWFVFLQNDLSSHLIPHLHDSFIWFTFPKWFIWLYIWCFFLPNSLFCVICLFSNMINNHLLFLHEIDLFSRDLYLK